MDAFLKDESVYFVLRQLLYLDTAYWCHTFRSEKNYGIYNLFYEYKIYYILLKFSQTLSINLQ